MRISEEWLGLLSPNLVVTLREGYLIKINLNDKISSDSSKVTPSQNASTFPLSSDPDFLRQNENCGGAILFIEPKFYGEVARRCVH
jgi:hypothetical protein